MARSIGAIQQQVFDKISSDANLSVANSISKTARWRLMVFAVSYVIWALENLFDTHKSEVLDIIDQKMPHRPLWYRTKALAFQYGFDLIEDTDKYDNTGYPEDQIEASKIIKYAAVPRNGSQKFIKIATETNGVLSPISAPQKVAFEAYMDEIADWGVDYIVVNHLPDILLLTMQIYCDPLVLDETGMNINNGNYPVEDAIKEYMKELPFDGELVLAHLVDKLQLVEGVKIPHIITAESQSVDIITNEYLPAQNINVKTVPESGYFTIPNFDGISYVV